MLFCFSPYRCSFQSKKNQKRLPKRQKKQKIGTLDHFVAKGTKQDEFIKDMVTAFAASNIPFEKLRKMDGGGSTLLRAFLDKYVRVDGEIPHIPDPSNLRRTYLPKVMDQGMKPLICRYIFCHTGVKALQDKIRTGGYFVAVEADETDDPRPENNYCVTVNMFLIPKVKSAEDDHNIEAYHIKLAYPNAVNNETLSMLIDELCFRF